MAAAAQVGVDPADAVNALASFAGIKRRLELLGAPHNIAVFDDDVIRFADFVVDLEKHFGNTTFKDETSLYKRVKNSIKEKNKKTIQLRKEHLKIYL